MLKRTATIRKGTRGRKRRPNLQRSQTWAKKELQVARSIEKKYFDTTISNVIPDVTTPVASTTVINAMQQGSSAITRVGNKITCLEVLFRGFLSPTDAVANPSDAVRLMLVHDSQTNGATPAVPNVLLNGANPTSLSFRALEHAPRFTVLWDRTFACQMFTIQSTAEMISGGTVRFFKGKVRIPAKLQTTTFKASSAATFADISSGALFWVYLSLYRATNTAKYKISLTSRCRFYDN